MGSAHVLDRSGGDGDMGAEDMSGRGLLIIAAGYISLVILAFYLVLRFQ